MSYSAARHEPTRALHHRLVISVEVELLDPTWTEQELLDNSVLFFQSAIDRAQRENDAAHTETPYKVDTDDMGVWTEMGYAADHFDLIGPDSDG